MGSVAACSGSDSELAELRAQLEDLEEQLEEKESEEQQVATTPTPYLTGTPQLTSCPITISS
jgi:hypothetical protein